MTGSWVQEIRYRFPHALEMHLFVLPWHLIWRGLGLFGEVPRIGQEGIVLAVWVLQLWLAPWWLARFRFGPAEWLWRSLSNLRRQPMRVTGRSP